MDNENLNSCGCDSKEENCGEHTHEHDCDCGCDCGEHENLVVDLEDENGNLVSCEIIDEFEYKDNQYVLVQNPENNSVYLFKAEMGDDGEELIIPEDKEFEEASAHYAELIEESED
ncbi:DUF1292 domain-containing protein [Clostridium kluyveri]|uniref:DUF1292 domain-containing protein n=1 Tax=Clostridium kluyveri TaxID=1534 RepID=A0A1L5F916_CLOKL|nr:DUF1292 domain-containing protein [Clostridium kluyveri]APM39320.1 hypothetical protein BS101_11480 [Clostridium kluyveri]UZQ50493.1 DUF1292 domain-containing protein [Clostridium kluyveri]